MLVSLNISILTLYFLFNVPNFTLDLWSTDNSEDDLFSSQPVSKLKKNKKKVTSSAPLPTLGNEYPCLVIFNRGADVQFPFQLLDLVDDGSQDVDKKWISGIMNTESRKRCRDLKCFPDYMVSVYAKIAKGIFCWRYDDSQNIFFYFKLWHYFIFLSRCHDK